jgi:hypothetical protein
MQGVILSDHDMVKQLIEKTQTKTGLSVSVSIIDKVYELGKKATDGFKEMKWTRPIYQTASIFAP